jgi:hypothetical protein
VECTYVSNHCHLHLWGKRVPSFSMIKNCISAAILKLGVTCFGKFSYWMFYMKVFRKMCIFNSITNTELC